MQKIDLFDYNFHDSTIKDVGYDGKVLTLYILDSYYENTYSNLNIKICIEEYDLDIIYIKQYPVFHKVKFKGKVLDFDSLKKLFIKGYMLEINEFFVSADSDFVVFECALCPYEKKRGYYKKILLKMKDIKNFYFENSVSD